MCQFTIRRKKQLTYAVIGMVFLFGGIEYAVILPTMWLYIEARFNAEQYFLGLMLAAFCFSGLFSGPLMGRWSDVTRKTKLILLFANCWEIAGNIMYFIGLSKWFLFASRLVSGVGAGAEATLIAELARETKADQRTGVLSLFIAVRQFGLLIGPGFNLFLRKLNFHIGPFLVDKYSAPGVFMAVLWTLLQLVIICFYSELPSLNTSAEESHNKKGAASAHTQSPTTYTTRLPQASENSSLVSNIPSANVSSAVNINTGSLPPEKSINYDEEFCENTNVPSSYPQLVLSKSSQLHEHEDFLNSSDLIESAERFISSDNPDTSTKLSRQHSRDRERTLDRHSSYGSVNHHPHRGEQTQSQNGGLVTPPDTSTVIVRTKRPWLYYYNEYMREPVVVLLGIQFIGLFNQVALETMITPLTQKYLGWGELENSLMYCGAGAQIIAVFFLVRWLSKRLLDRTMILIGCSVLTIANCWLVWVIPNAVPDSMSKNLAKFLVGLVLDMFALPFLIVCSVSLYSKVTHKETQGFSQGLRRSVCGVATIMGPLWAGSALPWPYVMLGVMLGLISVATIMLLVSFPCLNVSEDVDKKIQEEGINNSDNDETKPLLS